MNVLVTGGSRGLGAALCQHLLENGASVWTCARQSSDQMVELAELHGERFHFESLDLSEKESALRIREWSAEIGGFDGFVANAGIAREGMLTLMSYEAIDSVIDVNLTSVIRVTREILKGMLTRRSGRIVFVSSIAARGGFTGLSVYAATKAGLCGFSKSLAREYGKVGIQSNVVLPGFFESEMTNSITSEVRDKLLRRASSGRFPAVGTVVSTVAYLLGEESQSINGVEWVVDNGAHG